jgi:hypothetical protein
VQKYYLELSEPNHYGGVMLWESKEALAAFQQSELCKTIPSAYGVKGAPCIKIAQVFDTLMGTEKAA